MNRRAVVAALMLLASVAGCGGDGSAAASAARNAADDYEITQMVTKWHEAMSSKNVDLALSLFAEDAVFTAAGNTYSGRGEIRKFLSTQTPLKAENHWASLAHTPSIRHTVTGDRGTLYFECHFFDVRTRQLVNSVSGDSRVVRVGNKWLFSRVVGGNAILG